MLINVTLTTNSDRPRAGSPVLVQLRDTSLMDAPAIVLAQVMGTIKEDSSKILESMTIEIPDAPIGATLYAHVDVDGDGRVSKGDYVTVSSYPIGSSFTQELTINVKRV